MGILNLPTINQRREEEREMGRRRKRCGLMDDELVSVVLYSYFSYMSKSSTNIMDEYSSSSSSFIAMERLIEPPAMASVEDEEQPRFLAQLSIAPSRIVNDATLLFGPAEVEKIPTLSDYEPPKYVSDMHDAPRFGHTNRLGKLASSNPEDALDYASGLKQFTLFVIVPFIIWGIILVLFKYIYGIQRIGCAAGGEVIDIKQLSQEGVSRKKRKQRIIRSWRLQTTFMITGILIPTISLIMMQSGWRNVQLAWEEVQTVVDDVEALAYRGWNVLDALQSSKKNLYDNELVQELLYKEQRGAVPLFSSWCPNAQGDERLAFIQDAMSNLEENTETLMSLFDDYVPENANGFISMTHATESVDDSIEWFFAHDWVWKMYIMALNVLGAFLVACCYIFSKHNWIHLPTRFYLTFFVVPLFSVATILLLMVTASSGVATLMNADFCAGGQGTGSPQGTIRDAIFSYQHGSVDHNGGTKNLTGTLGLVYESFSYYANGCLTDNPLAFLDDYADRVDQAATYLVELTENLPNTNATVAMLNQECGGDISFLPKALKALEKELLVVQSNVKAMVDMSSCHNISPLLRRLTHGSVCKESAHGLTYIWVCSLVICICCFVMLTTRAALYNSVKRRKKRDKKPKRVVEKEFEEYKEFMTDYYDDAPEWKLKLAHLPDDKKKKKVLEIDFADLQTQPTFETAVTTKPSMDDGEDDDAGDEFAKILDISQEGGILFVADDDDSDDVPFQKVGEESTKEALFINTNEDENAQIEETSQSNSSYDSDYESDSDESEEGEISDDESALLSFYTETKSILSETKSILSEAKSRTSVMARRAVQKFRTLQPLLGKPKEDDDLMDDEISLEDNSLFLHSPPPPAIIAESGDGLWNYVTPPSKNALSMIGLKTPPMAPQKPFSYLGRVCDAEEHELAPLTLNDDGYYDEPSSKDAGVQPRRLRLSPFAAMAPHVPDEQPKAKPTKRPRRVKSSSRMNLAITTPEHRITEPTTTRPRLGSDSSDDMSLYIEDAPKKAYRRMARSSLEETSRKSLR